MTTTFKDLTNQAHSLLRSYTGLHEQVTWLTASCTAGSLTLTVNDVTGISIGVSEVEGELVYVTAVDSDTNTLTIAPFGRGYAGSVAASHGINAQLTYDPAIPVMEIQRALRLTLAGIYPELYQLKTTTLVYDGVVVSYALPADCDGVVKVEWETVGPTRYWAPVTRWEFNRNSAEDTGKALIFGEAPLPGRTVRVTYRANFGTLDSDTTTLDNIGLPESATDVLLYGATSRLIRFLDIARLQLDSVENMARATLVSAGQAAKLADSFYAMFRERLAEERAKLLELSPPQIHFGG